MKILSVVGARPQFIKASFLSQGLRGRGINEILVHTGQHYDFEMSEVFFKELNLPFPEYYLGVGSGLHGEQTGKMMIKLEEVVLKEEPDLIIVYGDTNSTLAGALVGAKLKIPIAHVEAGLRSFNKNMPEEINRILTDHISTVLFAPTETAIKNLRNEGIIKGVYKVGDIMFDVAKESIQRIDEEKVLNKYGLKQKKYILVTIHRAESTDLKENLNTIIEALKEISEKGIKLIFPIHPRTKKALETFNIKIDKNENFLLISPVSYFEMLVLEKNSKLIITDSGGVQKEGYFFKVPCIIPRNETEWIELIDSGWNVLSGIDKNKIIENSLSLYFNGSGEKEWLPFYGEGKTAENIINIIKEEFDE